MTELRYDEEYAVELYDRVEVRPSIIGQLDERVYDGQVVGLRERSGKVIVRYDTDETYRTSGKPIFKTAPFDISQVALIARDQ
ncbi:MAG TPA: hypothetical protein VMF90_06010 [Rhizobiaceae bacterium]|nr:hypothetical protein [Rhizobiaceae bacterium]